MFEKIKRFFNLKLYTKKQIHQFAEKGVITKEQYKLIIGEDYWLIKPAKITRNRDIVMCYIINNEKFS